MRINRIVTDAEMGTQFEEARPYLLRFLRGFLYHPEHAEDIVQTTLLRAWERREQFEERSSVRTWLVKICVSQAYQFGRKVYHQREVPMWDKFDAVDPRVPVSECVAQDQLVDQVREALGKLPKHYQEAMETFGTRESVTNTVKIRRFRAIREVRRRLKMAKDLAPPRATEKKSETFHGLWDLT